MFLLVCHIPLDIVLPISHFLTLDIQPLGCFLKDVRFFIDLMAAFFVAP